MRSTPNGLTAGPSNPLASEARRARLHLAVESDAPGSIQLAHAFYPALAVRINGAPVTPRQGSFGLVVLPIEAGRSEIEISLPPTGVRVASAAVAIAAMAGAALCYARRTRRQDKGGGRG